MATTSNTAASEAGRIDPPSVAAADWFVKPETQAVFACLNREGFEVRAVGGAVRNTLMGLAVTEVDFATTAKPEDVVRLASEAGIKTVPTGIAHGTLTLVVHGIPFEVTTLRRDVETDGRRATVAFESDWAGDACRRDFTLNALYADAAGEIHDPLGGLRDVWEGRVRFVGDPAQRIREDYLRILRFFRFSAEYCRSEFDREGVAAAIRERAGLMRLSRERVRAELLRILAARRAPKAIEIMDEAGLLVLLLGGVARRARFERLCQIEAVLNLKPDPVFRLAALGLFVEEDAARLALKLRLSSAEARDLEGLAAISPAMTYGVRPASSGKEADQPGPPSTVAGKRTLEALLYKLGARLYLGRLLLAWATSDAPPDDATWRSAAELAAQWQRPSFPLSGADLIALGLKPGPAMGALLKALEEEWAAAGFSADRDTLLALAKQRAAATPP